VLAERLSRRALFLGPNSEWARCSGAYFFLELVFREVAVALRPEAEDVLGRTERFNIFVAPEGVLGFVIPDRFAIGFGSLGARPFSADFPMYVPRAPPKTAPMGPATAAPNIRPVAPPATVFRMCSLGSGFVFKESFFTFFISFDYFIRRHCEGLSHFPTSVRSITWSLGGS